MTEITTLRPMLPATAAPAAEAEVLPHNIEAEQQLLGAILTNNDVFDRISSLVKAEHFFDPSTSASMRSRRRESRRTRSPRRSR
jgi:replicative DNA helicase